MYIPILNIRIVDWAKEKFLNLRTQFDEQNNYEKTLNNFDRNYEAIKKRDMY